MREGDNGGKEPTGEDGKGTCLGDKSTGESGKGTMVAGNVNVSMLKVGPLPELLDVDCFGVACPDDNREGEGGWVVGREATGVLLNHSLTLSEDALLPLEAKDDRIRGEPGVEDVD